MLVSSCRKFWLVLVSLFSARCWGYWCVKPHASICYKQQEDQSAFEQFEQCKFEYRCTWLEETPSLGFAVRSEELSFHHFKTSEPWPSSCTQSGSVAFGPGPSLRSDLSWRSWQATWLYSIIMYYINTSCSQRSDPEIDLETAEHRQKRTTECSTDTTETGGTGCLLISRDSADDLGPCLRSAIEKAKECKRYVSHSHSMRFLILQPFGFPSIFGYSFYRDLQSILGYIYAVRP